MKKIIIAVLVCIVTSCTFSACVNANLASEIKEINEPSYLLPEAGDAIERESEDVRVIVNNAEAALNAGLEDLTSFKYICDVEYGMYPQTKADKKAVREMSRNTDATGYYYSTYDGEHYAKVSSAVVYGNKYEFMDENVINENETYYFKVEPIKWRMIGRVDLTAGNIEVYLLSDLILDSMEFCESYVIDDADGEWYNTETGTYANNWAYSKVRKWLNEDFYKAAFTAEEKERLISRNTSDVCAEYNPDDATENVFTLTYAQAVMLGDSKAQVSDYARTRNTFISIYPEFYGNGRWWLCTPGNKSYRVAYASNYNMVSSIVADVVSGSGESVGLECMGVRPAICLTLTKELLEQIIVVEEED